MQEEAQTQQIENNFRFEDQVYLNETFTVVKNFTKTNLSRKLELKIDECPILFKLTLSFV